MPADRRSRGDASLAVATALAVAAATLFVGGMVVMAVFMSDHMGSGMMGPGRGSSSPQTPVVSDRPQVSVEMRDFDYFPRELTVQVGSEVTWINRDSAPHTATDKADGWDTGILNKDEGATLTFDMPGTYEYFCTLHPYMTATLSVR